MFLPIVFVPFVLGAIFASSGCSSSSNGQKNKETEKITIDLNPKKKPGPTPEPKPAKEQKKMSGSVSRTVIAPPQNNGVYFCAFLGDDKDITPQNIKAEEKKTGEELDCVLKFWSVPAMRGGFPTSQAEAAYQTGAALFIKEMPGEWGQHTPRLLPEINTQIKNKSGKHYDYYVSFAKRAAKWGVGTGEKGKDKPIFVSLGHEMNVAKGQNWSYSFAGDPKEYKEYFSLVHDLMLENGATNVTFVFNPNIGEEDAMEYFPTACGTGSCVDWIGFDKYQKKEWASWQSGRALYEHDVSRFKKFNLPMMIAEYGRNRTDAGDGENNVTIRGTIEYTAQPQDADGIDAFTYFDTNKDDGSWGLSGANLNDFKAGMAAKRAYFADGIQTKKVPLSGVRIARPKIVPQAEPPKQTAPAAKVSALNVKDIEQGSFAFNGGSLSKSGNVYQFSADHAKDPGAGIVTGNKDVSNYKALKFEIKGGLTQHGGWARLAVQIYSSEDNDYSPSVSLAPVELGGSFSPVTVDLQGMQKVKKVQFLLITDNGSCNVEIKNLRFE